MPLVLKDRVKETTTTTGTGTVTLAGAVAGFDSFSVIGNANTTYYAIVAQTPGQWEVGIGTYTSSGTTLSRDTILASSNAGAAVNFSAGTKDVFVTYPAAEAVTLDDIQTLTNKTLTSAQLNGETVVSVNTSTPALRITQVGTGNALVVEDSTNPDSTPFVVNASGNVGIGTTTPATALDVNGNVNITGNTTLGDATTDSVRVNGFMGVGGAATSSRALQISSSALTGTTQVGLLSQPTANSAATSELRSVASFPAVADSAFTVPNVSAFYASVGSKGAAATATNWHGVYISDQTQGTNNFGITSLVSSGANKWNIYASGTAANYFAGEVQIADKLSHFADTDTAVRFPAADTVAVETAGSERMRITSAGNVGIGTTTPATALDVNGTITATNWSGGGIVTATATQTLTNKTISVDDNTVSGIAASSFVLSNASGNVDGAAAQKAIPTGVVVGTTDTQTLTNKTAERLVLNDGYTEEVFAITDGATVNLDPNNGSIQTWTLGANRTPDQANWAAGQSITLMIDDGTARTITWTTLAVVWETNGGNAPTLALTGFTTIVLWKVDTTIYGARVGDN